MFQNSNRVKIMKIFLLIPLSILFFYGCGDTKSQYVELKKIDNYKIVDDIDALCKLFPIDKKDLRILSGTFSKESDKTIENFKKSIAFGYFYQGNFRGPVIVPTIHFCNKNDYKIIILRNAYDFSSEHKNKKAKGFLLVTKDELSQAGFLNNDRIEEDICIEANINKYTNTDKIDHFKISKEEINRALQELE